MEFIHYSFFRYALIAIFLISVSSAIVGVYVVTRRLAALAGGVTHACFGGLGLGYLLSINPLWPAMGFAVASSWGVERMSRNGFIRSDSAIAVVWAIGMALGVLFVFLTPGYVPELNSFLFGNIFTVSRLDLWLEAGFALLLVGGFAAWHKYIVACAFDPDFAQVSGMPVKKVNMLMTLTVAIGIVLTIRLVGVMLLMAMLTLPALTAERFSRNYGRMTLLAVIISLATTYPALWLSALVNVPCSAFIVLIQALVFGASRLPIWRKKPYRASL